MWKQRPKELKQSALNYIPNRKRGRTQTQNSYPVPDTSSTILITTLYCPLSAPIPGSLASQDSHPQLSDNHQKWVSQVYCHF